VRDAVGHATTASPTQSCRRRRLSTTRNTTDASLGHRRLPAARHATATSQAPAQTSRCQPRHHDAASTYQAEPAVTSQPRWSKPQAAPTRRGHRGQIRLPRRWNGRGRGRSPTRPSRARGGRERRRGPPRARRPQPPPRAKTRPSRAHPPTAAMGAAATEPGRQARKPAPL
jgi:hypothetical protein